MNIQLPPKDKKPAWKKTWLSSYAFAKFSEASAAIRSVLGIERLPKDVVPVVKQAVAKHEARQANKPPAGPRPGLLFEKQRQKVAEQVAPLARKLYRTSQSNWAGGERKTDVKFGQPNASGEAIKRWSNNNKWTGNDSHFVINVSPNWLSKVASVPGLPEAGGMLTTHANLVGDNLWQAAWVVQSRGFDLRAEQGFILLCQGEWFHGPTQESVIALAKKRSKFVAGNLRKNDMLALSKEELIAKFGGVVVQRADSLAAGNCQAGTDNWIARHFPERASATVGEILSVETTDFAKRAVIAAILKARR